MQGKLSFNYLFGSFRESLVKLCGMIILHKMRDQLLWNDILVKKVGGTPSSTDPLTFEEFVHGSGPGTR
jgi:hypothetical protein